VFIIWNNTLLKKKAGFQNKEIGNIFAGSDSAVNKAAIHEDNQIKTRKHLKRKRGKVVDFAFNA